jgi:hypothetical protein
MNEKSERKADVELMGLSLWRQNEILTERVLHLSQSKLLAKKVTYELHEELENYQQKNMDATVEMKNCEHSVENFRFQQKIIEEEINAEVERIKNTFAKIFFKKLQIKNEYDQNDLKMRAEILPKIATLQNSIDCNNNEIFKINDEMRVLKELIKIEDSLELQFAEKCEYLSRDFERKVEDIFEMEKEVTILMKAISKVGDLLKKKKIEMNEKVDCIKENNLILQKIKEIQESKLNYKFDLVESDLWNDLARDDKTIRTLKLKVCELCQKICHANVTVEQLESDINYLMHRGPKIVVGIDYTGGNFMKVNK